MADETFENFLIWVDGVGGYLVCGGTKNQLGQAIPDTNVSIPLRGDIERQHATIESIAGNHMLIPSGPVHVDRQAVEQPLVLASGQIFRMGDMVSMRYRKPHPFSSTAILEFESRHRTFPWSDAVLLAGDTIVMGPQQRNHIVCPKWSAEIILFRRSEKWFCKSSADIMVDSAPNSPNRPLSASSRVENQEFSFSIEGL